MAGPRILTLDIETSAHVVNTWGLFDQTVGLNQLLVPTRVICFAAKWHGDKRVLFYSDFHDGHEEMIAQAWRLMNEADWLITFNGRSFDVKHLHREFLLAGLTPPSPHHDIDLLSAVRAKFRFASNKLDHVSQQLGIGAKKDTGGFDLWKACADGDAKAWNKMRTYCKGDVVLTEQVYDRLVPWIPRHPNRGLWSEEAGAACPKCGSTDLQRRGTRTTGAGVFARYQCNSCGAWSRSAKRQSTTELRETA